MSLSYFNKDFQRALIKDCYILLKSKKDTLVLGYRPNERAWAGEKWETEFLTMNAGGIRYALSQEYMDYMSELVEVCKRHAVQLIFVISPEISPIVTAG